jgi:flagellar biosynthesis protein FlhB
VSEEKTEAPTAKKKKEARKEGQVPRTQELGSWATLAAFGMLLELGAGRELASLRDLMARAFRVAEDPDPAKAMDAMGAGLTHAFTVIVVLASMVMVIGVCAALAQGGFYVATKSVTPKFSKLNPVSGFKRLFGMQTVWEGAKMLVKSLIVGLICYQAIKAMVPLLGGVVPAGATIELGADRVTALVRTVGLVGLLMAGADYAFQRRKVGKQVRMTKHEVKQESKQTEGDPLVKGAIRSRQMAAARNRMMADVPKADVVLVNPTHVAVALVYDPASGAPRVVAKGAGAIAAKIRAKAADAGVPLVRDVPLARALHSGCKVGQEIPVELFAAVAQVLAFVISRRTQGQRGGSHESPRTGDELPAVQPRRRRTAMPPAPA